MLALVAGARADVCARWYDSAVMSRKTSVRMAMAVSSKAFLVNDGIEGMHVDESDEKGEVAVENRRVVVEGNVAVAAFVTLEAGDADGLIAKRMFLLLLLLVGFVRRRIEI